MTAVVSSSQFPVQAFVPCTCGELFQGLLYGEPCLVSCPIALFSRAWVGGAPGKTSIQRKARQALQRMPIHPDSFDLVSLDSPLPPGRGYGTSTADIGAALFAVAKAYQFELDSQAASQIAVSIEPTDSTLFPGLALFDHLRGRFWRALGVAPAIQIVILDPGGFVDTEEYNRQDWKPALQKLADEQRRAFDLLETGVSTGDLECFGAAATLSAQLHQSILPNLYLETAIACAKELGALGVCRAHSGVILGMLFEPRRFDMERIYSCLEEHLPAGVQIISTALVGGGPRDSAPDP